MEVRRAAEYLKGLKRLKIDDVTRDEIEGELAGRPDAGDVIPGSGGARKARIALGNRGKRGGGRVVYYVADGPRLVMLKIYAKARQENLSPDDMKAVRDAVREEKDASHGSR